MNFFTDHESITCQEFDVEDIMWCGVFIVLHCNATVLCMVVCMRVRKFLQVCLSNHLSQLRQLLSTHFGA